MLKISIKAHKTGVLYANPHYFVLNKGLNSGKPQKEPFTNSFVIIFHNDQDCENHFHVAYSLWITKFWHQYLVGTSIKFLRLEYFKIEFPIQAKRIMEEFVEYQKKVAAIKLAKLREQQYHNNNALINEAKKERAYWYYRKREQ
jgi:hypothetical protein